MFVLNFLAKLIFKLSGWKVEGNLPPRPHRFLLVIAPHTSNWDVVYAVGAAAITGLKIRFLANKKVFIHVQGPLLHAFGGIPINKEQNEGVVPKAVQLFKENTEFVLALNPEGGLVKCKDFRTGFYYIAQQAQIPLLVSYFDYKRKVVGIGELYHLTGDMERDFNYLWDFYKDKVAKYPEMGIYGIREPKKALSEA